VLQLYDTLQRRLLEFKPLVPSAVCMYTCGPTVYNFPHIGNYRTFIFEDVLRRYLQYLGYRVVQVMNLTDVDDKTIRASQEKGVTLDEITAPFIRSFFSEIDLLGIQRAEHYPRATQHVEEMIKIISSLLEKGIAYTAADGIYFSISKFPDYGKLSGVSLRNNIVGARVAVDEYDKEESRDFALWKFARPNEPCWEAPFGKGRPGWHIECTAMSIKYLGETFDIHTGGVDNIFPHHENEIAQSESYTGKRFVNYWLHSEHLLVEGRKMAKSEGNFFVLGDLLAKGYKPLEIRYLLVGTPYRRQLNFTFDGLLGARAALERLENFQRRLREIKLDQNGSSAYQEIVIRSESAFREAMDDDLNTARAIGVLWDFVREVNAALDRALPLGNENRRSLFDFLGDVHAVLGIIPEHQEVSLEEWVEKLMAEREEARRNRDFTHADEIRKELAGKGIILEDTKDGVRWKKV